MCTRYHLSQEHHREILAELGIAAPAGFASRYNIAPNSAIPVVRPRPGRGRETASLRWGLTPAWARADEPAARLVNARAETLAAKPSFRDALRARRCVMPITGFYEWETVGREKRPWYFRPGDGRRLALAGLWETWRAPGGAAVESCAVITTVPNAVMRPIHDRMPVLLSADECAAWLGPDGDAPATLARLLRPPPDGALHAIAVGSHVSNVRHEGPACLAPSAPPDTGEAQLSLGL